MKLQELFDRDIHRHINPAVTVSDSKAETIKAEIEEYVFTDDLIEQFFLMLDTVLNRKQGKTGIWINGYYGSGKSHFIKYVHYLLNADTQALAFDMLEKAVEGYDGMRSGGNSDITPAKLRLLRNRATSSQCDDILFNAEEESDDGDVQERMTRILLSVFNRFRGYNPVDDTLALVLEKRLDRKGVFEEFKAAIKAEMKEDWTKEAHNIKAWALGDVLKIAKRLDPDMDVDSMRAALEQPDRRVSIADTLIPELQDHLTRQDDPNYRLLFLVDEISQYVGNSKEILLNIQSIVERISKDCNNQVWLACTAQQSLDEVSENVDNSGNVNEAFGKILGRFETRISLQSNDAAYITQRRVLDKNSSGMEALGQLFDSNKDFIENQFKISHELYKGYGSRDEFINAYPFVPYQFKLISDVFSAFQKLGFVVTEVKDNERSVLGITHYTTKDNADMEVGKFMSFDAFYNGQFSTNLTHTGGKAIENGLSLSYVQQEPFAQRVVKVLFMVSNLSDSQRQTFPSSIENLTVLLMDQLDQNRKQLQDQIRTVLEKLQEASIVREENGSYFFFNEDEMEVQSLIKNQNLALADQYDTFWQEFFGELTSIRKSIRFGENDFNIRQQLEDKVFHQKGDFTLKVLLRDDATAEAASLNHTKKDLVVCINEWFNTDDVLKKNFVMFCKTNKYFINNSGGATGARAKTHENFRIRNKQLKGEIAQALKNRFKETRFISQQQVLDASDITGATPKERLERAIEKHLAGIYSKHKLSAPYAQNAQAVRESAASQQQFLTNELDDAESLVNDVISRNNDEMNASDLFSEFDKDPFGWKMEATLDILVHLVKKKHREFRYNNEPRYSPVDFVNKALKTAEQTSCQVVKGEAISQDLLDGVMESYRFIFNEELPETSDADALFTSLKEALKTKRNHYHGLQETYYGVHPWGKAFHSAVELLGSWMEIRDLKRLFQSVQDGVNFAKETLDGAKAMQGFAERSGAPYAQLKSFMANEASNLAQLDAEAQGKAAGVRDFLELEDPTREFRQAMKAKEELEKALTDLLQATRTRVRERYDEIGNELEKLASEKSVSSDAYASKADKLADVAAATTIAGLLAMESQADDFRHDEIHKIVAAAAPKPESGGGGATVAETVTYRAAKHATTLSSQADLDAYIEKLRADLEKQLGENKTIILE